jgi:hypothetical protein
MLQTSYQLYNRVPAKWWFSCGGVSGPSHKVLLVLEIDVSMTVHGPHVVKEHLRRSGRDSTRLNAPKDDLYIGTFRTRLQKVLTRSTSTRRLAWPLDGMTTMACVDITAPRLHRVSFASAT